MKGYVHSTESFGTVDGPGIRYVVFLQGCPMRCKYCHNPDTWPLQSGVLTETDDILMEYENYRPFLKNGGITASGGEPLMQIDFVIDLFEKAQTRGIHTCLDTSGIIFQENNPALMEKFERLVKATNLVILDIKHIDPTLHKDLTGQPNDEILAFANYLDTKNVPIWIRHVVVPTITDKDEYLERLGYFIGGLKNIKALDVLPYHSMGIAKYDQLDIEYPLLNVKPLKQSDAVKARDIIITGIKTRLHEKNKN